VSIACTNGSYFNSLFFSQNPAPVCYLFTFFFTSPLQLPLPETGAGREVAVPFAVSKNHLPHPVTGEEFSLFSTADLL
jgi:hypothetical protein